MNGMTGRQHTKATRRKMSESQRRRFGRPEERAKLAEGAKRGWIKRRGSSSVGPA